MENYYVNKNEQDNGEHEVHRHSCSYLPEPENRVELGKFSNCQDAVKKAREFYEDVDGCAFCCRTCHKG
jgi:hypothetical protein